MDLVFQNLNAAFHKPDTKIYRYVQGTIGVLILISILILLGDFAFPEKSVISEWLNLGDQILLSIFTLEIFLRVASYHPLELTVFAVSPAKNVRIQILSRLRYLLRPMMLIDFLAVLALFPGLRGLRVLRLLRLLRTSTIFRYRNPFAIIFRAFEESSLLFSMTFMLLFTTTLLGGVSFYFVEANINSQVNSLADGIWWALVTITTVGFGDITPVTLVGRVIAGILMISGMLTLAMFAGIVGSILVKDILSIREEQFRMSNYVNHIVVCGYDESTHLLLEALANEFDLSQKQVVMIDNHERPRGLSPEIFWVQGDSTKESELDKVRLTHASSVIVSGERDTTPQIADARTILIVFTIRSYLNKHQKEVDERLAKLYVLAEILDSENVHHAKTSGADEVIETRKIGYSMIAHAAGYHGTASVMSGMLLGGAHSVYVGKISDDFSRTKTFGDLMIELKLSQRGGLVVGIRNSSGEEIINPAKSFKIEPGMQLLYLAKDQLLDPPLN